VEPWTALLVGLGGSLHCVGMCGPLALALSPGSASKTHFVFGRLLYNAGRVVTYAILGGVFGLLGGVIQVAGWQQSLSVGVGVVIIASTLLSLVHRRLPLASLPARAVSGIKSALGRLLRLESAPGLLLVGILNGLLPCGLVYLALAGSLTAGGPVQGMIYMVLFGIGTIPLMLATSLMGRLLLRPQLQVIARRAVPLGMLLLGAWFILRGLGLGIPYLSPMLGGGEMMHHSH
jgi:uncharacterized protein